MADRNEFIRYFLALNQSNQRPLSEFEFKANEKNQPTKWSKWTVDKSLGYYFETGHLSDVVYLELYVKNDWEVQILDSFGWHHENRKFERLSKFGRCGGIHEMIGPRINMSYPPLAWQTYDIELTMARFDASGKRTAPALMTVLHNGVSIHDKYVLPPVPPGRNASQSKERQDGPIFLQNHGNPVRFRNIWVVERK